MQISKIGMNETTGIGTENKETKALANNETEPKIAGKEALDNPMELVGRSQVNFQARNLSNKDLNDLALVVKDYSDAEIKIIKQALVATKKDLKCHNFNDFRKKFGKSIDDAIQLQEVFINNVRKIDKNADADKLANVIIGII